MSILATIEAKLATATSPPPGHAPYYAPGSHPVANPVASAPPEGEDVAVANLASMVARMLTGIASHTHFSVSAIAEVLVSKLQRIRMMSVEKRSKQESGEISSALGANGCDIVVDKQASNDNASALITVPVVCGTAATMPVVGADLAGVVGDLKKTKVSVSLDTANGLRHITEAVDVPNAWIVGFVHSWALGAGFGSIGRRSPCSAASRRRRSSVESCSTSVASPSSIDK